MSKHPLSEAEVDALVDEIHDRLGDSTARTYGRRGVLAALGLATLGTGSASAQASGTVGTAGSPVDVFGYDVDASNSFTDPAGVTHSGELADISDVGASGQWQEVNSGANIEPIDGETIGTGSEDVDVGSVSTGQVNNAVRVKSESDLAGLTGSQYGYIPPETTVNITSQFQPPGGLDLDVYGELRQADGADMNNNIIFPQGNNTTIRVFGEIDGNQSNQTASSTGLYVTFNNGSNEPTNHQLFGPGTITNMQGPNVFLDNGGKNTYFGGLTIKNWVPNGLNNSFVSWDAGNDTSDNFLVEGLTFEGSTFGGTAGDGDCVSGPGSDQTGLVVRGCDFFDIPRRGIQGAQRADSNRFVNPAVPGGGGDAIASCRFVTGNYLLGSFDSNGDNGIVLFGDSVCSGNYVEGFSNNGIRFDNATGNAQLFIVTNNWCVDNNQDGSPGNGNIKMDTTNSTGGFIAKNNICYGDSIDPLNNISVGSNIANGRVTENVATGATTDIDDQSGSSVAVVNNITI